MIFNIPYIERNTDHDCFKLARGKPSPRSWCPQPHESSINANECNMNGGQSKVVKYILRTPKLAGLINEADEDGNTPLHVAVINKKVEIISILTADHRVDKAAVNKKFSKAIDIFLGQNSDEQGTIDSPVLHQLGSCVGGPFFQQKISHDFNIPETLEKDTPGTRPLNTRSEARNLLPIRP
ncbi:unnamed protein product [Prunus armeniaca]